MYIEFESILKNGFKKNPDGKFPTDTYPSTDDFTLGENAKIGFWLRNFHALSGAPPNNREVDAFTAGMLEAFNFVRENFDIQAKEKNNED